MLLAARPQAACMVCDGSAGLAQCVTELAQCITDGCKPWCGGTKPAGPMWGGSTANTAGPPPWVGRVVWFCWWCGRCFRG